MKKITAIAICMLLVLAVLVGCGKDDPEKIIANAAEQLNTVESARYDMNVEFDMTVAGQTIETETTSKAACIIEPMQMEMDMTMSMGELGAIGMLIFMEQQEDKYISYSSMDGGTTWTKEEVVDVSSMDQYDALSGMDIYLNSGTEFTEMGAESINGMDTVRYDGIVDKEALEEVMEASGAVDQLTQYGITEEAAKAMYGDLDNIPMSIWIDTATGYPVKYEMDMSGIMSQMLNEMFAQAGDELSTMTITVEKMVVSILMYDFNEVESIEIPEAAKAA